jgi:hypothetical protein
MLSLQQIATINAEIEKLEYARKRCTDFGILKVIDGWIDDQKKKLEAAPQNKVVPAEQRNRSTSPGTE